MDFPWTCPPALQSDSLARVRRRAIFDSFKWLAHSENPEVACPFPLVLELGAWVELAGLASALAAETLAAEQELVFRPALQLKLGLPRPLRHALRQIPAEAPTPGGARVMRFDFHHTTDGWKLAGAVTDVVSGYIEACGVTRLMATEYPGGQPPGDPAAALATANRHVRGPGSMVGLAHLPAFNEDRQELLYLAHRLEEFGLSACLFHPEQVHWRAGKACVDSAYRNGPLDIIVRAFPADWLCRLSTRTGWTRFVSAGATMMSNPGYALLTQGKRFPLVWDELKTPLPVWRSLWPETRSPRDSAGLRPEEWILRPAIGPEGINVGIEGVTAADQMQRIRELAAAEPDDWVMHRRPETTLTPTPDGPRCPVIGVYVIDGKVAGARGLMRSGAFVIEHEREVVTLVRSPEPLTDLSGASRFPSRPG